MKKALVLISILMVSLMAGCSGAQAETQDPDQVELGAAVSTDKSNIDPQGMQNAAEVTQLLFGTLMLEGTEHEVTPEQAAELLPLWKLYRSLLESDITATEEIEAVAKQLSQKMTSEQLATMEEQEFDREQMNTIMEELGVDMFGGIGGRGEGFEPPDGFTPPDGFQPGQGGGPGGGAGRGDGAGIDPEMLATRQAAMDDGGGFQRGLNLPLIEALIEWLVSLAG